MNVRVPRLAVRVGLLAGAALLCGCADPVQSAAGAIANAEAEWRSALGDLDPTSRLRAYEAVIRDLERVAEKYPETPQGQALAAARSVGDVSLATMRATRDRLAERARCYADPTVDCLRPFASRSSSGAAVGGAQESAFAEAQRLVCEEGFAAADRPLEPFKINRAVYAQQLVQVALAAAECSAPDAVRAAIDAYSAAEPATGAARIQSYLSILATEPLRPAWPSVLGELETVLQSDRLDGNSAASIALNMAIRYAALGDVRAALDKYEYFTDTLNYQADIATKMSLATHLISAGDAETAFELLRADNPNAWASAAGTAAHDAVAAVAVRLGLVNEGAPTPRIGSLSTYTLDVHDYFAPVDAEERARYAATASAVESALDEFIASVPPQQIQLLSIGLRGVDGAYGILALVHQKLEAPEKAAAALAKIDAFRDVRLPAGAGAVGQEYVLPQKILVSLAQGKHADAVAYAQQHMGPYYLELILRAIAASGDAEQALTAAGQLGASTNTSAYVTIIEALIDAGRLDQAERVIGAFAGDATQKSILQWQIVTKAANDGDPDRAEQAATRFGLLSGPGDRLRLVTIKLNSEEVARDRRRAEPILREISTLGEQLDQAGGGVNAFQRNERYLAQEAARLAFYHGHVDLGIELYRAASRKDQRPLFAAFKDGMRPRDMTPILMLAHDSVQGEELGYVIDAAIRQLEKS